jgi:phosphomannomutase
MPGAMITASHNPKDYNGIKFMLPKAKPLGSENGLLEIIENANELLKNKIKIKNSNKLPKKINTLKDYVNKLHKLVDLSNIKPIKIVIDAANAMGGLLSPAIFKEYSQIKIIPLYFELDPEFPNHTPNPLDFTNLKALQKKVLEENADLGLAFDGDADRCFMVDETGAIINPSAIICAIASIKLKEIESKNINDRIIIRNLITSKIIDKVVAKNNGKTVVTKVGHSFIKREMSKQNAIFGGEHSAHYYFKEFFFADTGMLAALNVINYLSKKNKKASKINKKYQIYYQSNEINSTVNSIGDSLKKIENIYKNKYAISKLDGITISNWDYALKEKRFWANVRGSNTEPLLRLNVEAVTKDVLDKMVNNILENIRD